MVDPKKTVKTVSIQRTLDRLNEYLWDDTFDPTVHVELVPEAVTVMVILLANNTVVEYFNTNTYTELLAKLRELEMMARFPADDERWWEWV